MNLANIKAYADIADGWLNDAEGRLLYRLANSCQGRGVIVEIGSWKGKSTIWLGHGSRAGSQVAVHAIDPHTGSLEHHHGSVGVWTFDEFQRNIREAEVEEVVVPHVDYSVAAAQGFKLPVELIFIDGQHEYEAVRADFRAWFPKVIEGGVVAFHDTTGWSGPRRLVVEEMFKSRQFKQVRFVRSITYGIKTEKNTLLDCLGNRLRMGVFLTYALVYRCLWRWKHSFQRKFPAIKPTTA